MVRQMAPVSGYCAQWEDDNIVSDMGLKTRWVWIYAAITLLVMCGMGCVMAGAGSSDRQPQGSTAPAPAVGSRQIQAPDKKVVGRPVEGFN